ncbi:MAG TPA: hypothetical protein DIU15_02275 [Deltaproteobacteria bacterium]|nr:hypothetical protein [Deltaproteobacteria bacterium]HCP44845.1 hypothetical protein [Deltaproteobacteria bacterium]
MFFPRTTLWGRLVASCLLAMTSVACQPEAPQLPDPDEQLPAVDCSEPTPLSITRLTPDSELNWPPWIQVCTLCPSASIAVQLGDNEGGNLSLVTAWGEEHYCAVALSNTPPPLYGALPAMVTVATDSRAGEWDFEVPIAPGREAAPTDLGSGTYRLTTTTASLRVPRYSWESLSSTAHWKPRSLLLRLGPEDTAGARPIQLAKAAGAEGTQDSCTPTWQLQSPAEEFEGQFAATLSAGDRFPTRFGDLVHRGALQARLSPGGAQLVDIAVLAVIDITATMDDETILEPESRCALWKDELGFNPCTPCDPPEEDIQGPAHCVTTLSEWRAANRMETALESISSTDLPEDCPDSPVSDDRTDPPETP